MLYLAVSIVSLRVAGFLSRPVEVYRRTMGVKSRWAVVGNAEQPMSTAGV